MEESNLSATLKQGLLFNKYQHKITTNKKNKEISSNLEETNDSILGYNKNESTDESIKIVEEFTTLQGQGYNISSLKYDVSLLSILQNKFNGLVEKYNTEKKNLLTNTNNYIDGINPSKNPYLNTNVTTADGKIYYITNEGVAKLYDSVATYNQIIGKNGCPTKKEQIGSLPNYIHKGGSNMVVNQQCGNEGKNVVVSKMINDNSTNYVGCYNDSLKSRAMTSLNNGDQIYDFTTCKQAAIDKGNLYFGLQNLNSTTNKSACYISNDFAKTTKYDKSTTACKSDSDGYIYGNNSVNAIYKIPDTTYVGLYKDTPDRAMEIIKKGSRTYNYETCKQEAIKLNKPFFGLQNFDNKNQVAECSVGENFNTISKYGTITDRSFTGNDNKIYGGSWTNALYQIETKKSDYIGCYNDDKSSPSMIPVENGASNYSMPTCRKYAILNGNKYFALQDGKKNSSKCFVSDDLTSAQKYGEYKPCVVAADKNTYGLSENNAVYKINSAGKSNYIGKMGYIDGNSQLLEYPNSMILPGTNYSKYPNYDSNSITIKTISDTTYNDCVVTCNSNDNYYGFTFDNSAKVGYLKGRDVLNPSLKYPKPNTDLYIRDLKINNATTSCNRNVVDIDSIQWNNFIKTGNMTPKTICSLTNILNKPSKKIYELQKEITKVGNQIISILKKLQKQSDVVKSNIGINSEKIDADLKMYDNTILEFKNYNNSENSMNNIVKDTDLLVLYQNYNYMFWTILAITTIIISMKVMGK
jgi:hypothetical protein